MGAARRLWNRHRRRRSTLHDRAQQQRSQQREAVERTAVAVAVAVAAQRRAEQRAASPAGSGAGGLASTSVIHAASAPPPRRPPPTAHRPPLPAAHCPLPTAHQHRRGPQTSGFPGVQVRPGQVPVRSSTARALQHARVPTHQNNPATTAQGGRRRGRGAESVRRSADRFGALPRLPRGPCLVIALLDRKCTRISPIHKPC